MTKFQKMIDVAGPLGFAQVVVDVGSNRALLPAVTRDIILEQYWTLCKRREMLGREMTYGGRKEGESFEEWSWGHKIKIVTVPGGNTLTEADDFYLYSTDVTTLQFAVSHIRNGVEVEDEEDEEE